MLNNNFNSIERTVRACNNIKSGVMCLVKSGAHPCALNPLTVCKIIKSKVYPSALYGCQLWCLQKSEYLMLERAQRFILKSIQGFHKRTRTDMCTGLLGWWSIEAYIDTKKLLFFGRLCNLDNTCITFLIFFTRLFMAYMETNVYNQGFIGDILLILKKYNLYKFLQDYLSGGIFPVKSKWKQIVKYNVHVQEENLWKERMGSDVDFKRFILVHENLAPHIFWKLMIKFPRSREAIHNVMSIIIRLRQSERDQIELCHKCGKMYNDVYIHIILQCGCTEELRDDFWCELISIFEITFNVYLHLHSDFHLFHMLIGGEIVYELNALELADFRLLSVEYVSKMLNRYFV